jgi:hypothetical protein
MRSNSLIMVCGEDLFNFWKLHSFVSDITETPEAVEYQQRIHELVTVKRPSIYFDMIDIIALKDTGGPETIRDVWGTIWDLASTFADHYCSDPRDRVFGLLALADSESREAFSPDYTKSATSVLLQLMEHHAKVAKRNDSRHDARCALDIIGAFGSSLDNPDIAAMWDRRRSALHDDDPFSDIIATRGLGPLATRGVDSCSSGPLPRRLVPDMGSGHVVMDVESHCTAWKNDAGEFFVPLLRTPNKKRRFTKPIQHDFSTGKGSASDGIRLRTSDGSVVGLANKQIQPRDTIFLFEDATDGTFPNGLIVRKHSYEMDGKIVAMIVGQCILDPDFSPCQGGSGCMCGDVTHASDKETWKVLMSPEDLLVFVAQDLMMVHRQPSKFEVPMVDMSVDLERSIQRLTTRVTSGVFSSYAIATPSNIASE